MRCAATILVLLTLLVPVPAQDDVPDGLLYCAHFDEHPAARWAAGSRAPIAFNPRLALMEGRFGRALWLACDEAQAWLTQMRDLMPVTDEVQTVSREDYENYPVVSKLADDLAGADYERMRRTTAEHIVALREMPG